MRMSQSILDPALEMRPCSKSCCFCFPGLLVTSFSIELTHRRFFWPLFTTASMRRRVMCESTANGLGQTCHSDVPPGTLRSGHSSAYSARAPMVSHLPLAYTHGSTVRCAQPSAQPAPSPILEQAPPPPVTQSFPLTLPQVLL